MTKTALIIGGTSGIGYGIAKSLHEHNIETYAVGRRQLPKEAFHLISLDVSAPNAADKLSRLTAAKKFDYVVFSAATEAPLATFLKVREKEYMDAFYLNVQALFFILQKLIKEQQLTDKARLLFLSSRLANAPEAGSLVYCMTKSALETLAMGITEEFSDIILSSIVIPGIVNTEMQARLRNADPKIFPHVQIYKNLEKKLCEIGPIAKKIVYYLCETTSSEYHQRRINFS